MEGDVYFDIIYRVSIFYVRLVIYDETLKFQNSV